MNNPMKDIQFNTTEMYDEVNRSINEAETPDDKVCSLSFRDHGLPLIEEGIKALQTAKTPEEAADITIGYVNAAIITLSSLISAFHALAGIEDKARREAEASVVAAIKDSFEKGVGLKLELVEIPK